MTVETLIISLTFGASVGLFTASIVKGYGLGPVSNIVVGITGAFIGGGVFRMLGIATDGNMLNAILSAAIGAVALLLLLTAGLIPWRRPA